MAAEAARVAAAAEVNCEQHSSTTFRLEVHAMQAMQALHWRSLEGLSSKAAHTQTLPALRTHMETLGRVSVHAMQAMQALRRLSATVLPTAAHAHRSPALQAQLKTMCQEGVQAMQAIQALRWRSLTVLPTELMLRDCMPCELKGRPDSNGCSCSAGYADTVSTVTSSPFYSSSGTELACPAN